MNNLTFELIPGGYKILNDGAVWINQPFNPTLPGRVPYTEAEATAAAEALIAELSAPAPEPTV